MGDSQYEKIKSWVFDQKSNAETESGQTTQSPSIFGVPPKLLDARRSAFEPEIFSFGMIYREDDYWDFKMSHVQRLFKGIFGDINGSNTSQSRNMVPVDGAVVLKDMIDLVEKTTNCYDEPTRKTYELQDFFETMATDGYYMVQLLRLCNKIMTDDDEVKQLDPCGSSSDSPVLIARWQLPSLLRDLIKLSNQLPLFLLEKLFSMTASGKDEPSLQDLFVKFFYSMLSLDKSIYMLEPKPTLENAHTLDMTELSPMGKYAHPLDLCRSLFIFPIQLRHQKATYQKINRKLMYSAQELQEAGVKFMKRENFHLLDIKFDEGALWIPPLTIDENMIVALLNFVAYEQCDRSQKPYFTNYFLFVDSLINTSKDVEILRKNGIIRYPLGTEQEVVDLFNNFCKEMLYSFDQTYLTVDMNAVNRYCKAFYDSKWRIWWSNLKKEKFSSPWTCLSLFAAIVLLTLTMLQTFYTIFPFYHRH